MSISTPSLPTLPGQAFSAQPASGTVDNVTRCFKKFDTRGRGMITREDLSGVLVRLDPNRWNDRSVSALMQAADRNGDGFINYNEFVTWLMQTGDCWDSARQAIMAEPSTVAPAHPVGVGSGACRLPEKASISR